jgi:uroporphyrinogen decarboxylase
MKVPFRPDHLAKAQWLTKQMQASDGLAPLDVGRFWADQEIAGKDPFGKDIPQVANGVVLTGECVFDELGIPEDYWRYDHDEPWRLEINKAYNDRSEKIVGRRLLSEKKSEPDTQWPETKSLADFFEAKNVWHDRSWWLMESAHDEDELKALLDRVEKRLENARQFMLPANWESEKARLRAKGVKPPLYRWQRGPVTFATSVYGPERFLLLVLDNPELAIRFRDTILKTMLTINDVLEGEAGFTRETAPRGFGFADDNCCLMTPDMYELFAYPIVKGMFDRCSPSPGDWRYQHSDSAMGHLLPILSRFNYSAVNFGPSVPTCEIRKHMPRTVIDGQLAPFTLSRDEHEKIVLEFLRDHEMTRETRGLRFATAGSINNGSRLVGMRLVMSAIQHFGRFADA